MFEEEVAEDSLVMPCNLGIKDAAVLAFKDLKVSKTALVRVSEIQDLTLVRNMQNRLLFFSIIYRS